MSPWQGIKTHPALGGMVLSEPLLLILDTFLGAELPHIPWVGGAAGNDEFFWLSLHFLALGLAVWKGLFRDVDGYRSRYPENQLLFGFLAVPGMPQRAERSCHCHHCCDIWGSMTLSALFHSLARHLGNILGGNQQVRR